MKRHALALVKCDCMPADRLPAEEPAVEAPLLDNDGAGQGPAATVRKWGRSVSIMLDHGGTVRRKQASRGFPQAAIMIVASARSPTILRSSGRPND